MSDQPVELDDHGHLADPKQWDEQLARQWAAEDALELGPLHWCVINFLREFYFTYHNTPPNRALIKQLKTEAEASGIDPTTITSVTLSELFPQGPIRQACRIAGLPKPARCL